MSDKNEAIELLELIKQLSENQKKNTIMIVKGMLLQSEAQALEK